MANYTCTQQSPAAECWIIKEGRRPVATIAQRPDGTFLVETGETVELGWGTFPAAQARAVSLATEQGGAS